LTTANQRSMYLPLSNHYQGIAFFFVKVFKDTNSFLICCFVFITSYVPISNMPTAITNDVKITVEVAYQNREHSPEHEHMFAYRITIENRGEFTVKLLRRHWYINDLNIQKSEVEGEGVVGQQPVLEPGESHQYVSGCAIQSDVGNMYGTYTMERQIDGKLFDVAIPRFNLIAPFRCN
jgi:ApaG protein